MKKIRSFMLDRLVSAWEHNKILVIDARSKSAFLKSHLPGAIYIDPFSPSFHTKLKGLPENQPVIVYCRSFKRSEVVCTCLHENGFKKVIQVADGFSGWKQNKLPFE